MSVIMRVSVFLSAYITSTWSEKNFQVQIGYILVIDYKNFGGWCGQEFWNLFFFFFQNIFYT